MCILVAFLWYGLSLTNVHDTYIHYYIKHTHALVCTYTHMGNIVVTLGRSPASIKTAVISWSVLYSFCLRISSSKEKYCWWPAQTMPKQLIISTITWQLYKYQFRIGYLSVPPLAYNGIFIIQGNTIEYRGYRKKYLIKEKKTNETLIKGGKPQSRYS